MNPMNVLAEKVADLQKARQQIGENRNQWTTVLKPFLIRQLTLVSETFPIGWSVVHSDSALTNLEHVSLNFDNTDSGIVDSKTGQPVIKQGGGLYVGQLVNGKIVVLFVYPSVGDFAKASPTETFGPFEPGTIDADFMADYAGQFLDAMTGWEESGEQSLPHIGF